MRHALEKFQDKWGPVIRPELRKNKKIGRLSGSTKSENALDMLNDGIFLSDALAARHFKLYAHVIPKELNIDPYDGRKFGL